MRMNNINGRIGIANLLFSCWVGRGFGLGLPLGFVSYFFLHSFIFFFVFSEGRVGFLVRLTLPFGPPVDPSRCWTIDFCATFLTCGCAMLTSRTTVRSELGSSSPAAFGFGS